MTLPLCFVDVKLFSTVSYKYIITVSRSFVAVAARQTGDDYWLNINVDQMRISGTEPSSVNPWPNKVFQKLKSGAPKVPKQAESKGDGVINPQKYNFNQF